MNCTEAKREEMGEECLGAEENSREEEGYRTEGL